MKTFRLSKRLKTLLWTSSALILNTVIVSSLTSCSLFKKDVINDIGGYDKQYGITQATYDKMENDFKEIYETDLETKHKQGEINNDEHESSLSSFRSRLNNFHNNVNSKENKTYSYTIKTNTLKNFAKDNYGIRLARYTGANLDNEISQIKNSMLMNLTMMIKQYEIDSNTSRDIITNATSEFADHEIYVRDHLKDDIVAAVQYLQSNMIKCFDGICKEMDLIVTQKQLSNFLGNVLIDTKEEVSKGKDGYYWNELVNRKENGYKKDTIISENDYNNIFDIKIKDHIPNLKSNLSNESSKIIEYSEDMITGYTLKPIVYDMVEDPIKNEYNIEVDFTLVNDHYKNDKDVAKLTAHSAPLKDNSIYENDDIDPFEINSSDGERQPSSYELPITQEFEKQQIKETYFYNDDFKFTWSDSDDYGFDNFWVDQDASGRLIGTLNKNNLANTGMMVGDKLLSNILYQSEFSLSGGSLELNGYSNIAGTDEKIWKLFKNGEQADSKKIEIKGWQLMSATNEVLPNQIHISYDWTNCLICWNKNITPGTYKLYAVAIYVKEKNTSNEEETICYCKSDLITLRITDENDSDIAKQDTYLENKVNLNDNSSNIMKQLGLIDFVKNTNFSLNYEEIDKNTEIKINSFNFSYNHHPSNTIEERVFEIETNEQDMVYKSLNTEINKKNGVTDRTAKKLFNSIKNDYDGAKNLYIALDDAIEKAENAQNPTDDLLIAAEFFLIISSVITFVFTLTLFLVAVKHKQKITWGDICVWTVLNILTIGPLALVSRYLDNRNSEIKEKLENIKDVWDKFDKHKFDEKDGSIKDNVKFIWNINNDWKYFYKISAIGVVANEDGFNNLNVELKKKIKTYYGTYKNDKVAGVALTQSQKDYKNFINIDNENNWIKDFYGDYYKALSWIMIILGAIEFLATVGVFIIGTHGNGSQSQDIVDIWRPVDKNTWKIRLQNIFNALDIITILIGELIMFLKTLWT